MALSAPPPSWASIKNKPNTVAGFGISDMASQSVANATNSTNATNVANVTTAQLLSAMAGSSVGAVGSYLFANNITYTAIGPGATFAGSNLRYSSGGGASNGVTLSGTWRCMGYANGNADNPIYNSTLFLRIA